jgi:hypothetical protein
MATHIQTTEREALQKLQAERDALQKILDDEVVYIENYTLKEATKIINEVAIAYPMIMMAALQQNNSKSVLPSLEKMEKHIQYLQYEGSCCTKKVLELEQKKRAKLLNAKN